MAYLAFMFVCLMWGSSFILIERVSHALGPVEIGIWRLLSAAVALGAIWWWRRDAFRFDRRYIAPILFSALVTNVPPYVTQPYVLAQGFGHSFFGVAVAAVPLLTILFSIPMLGVLPTRRQLVGVIGGLVCLYFVVDDGVDRGMSFSILALAAVVPVTASFNNNYVKLKLDQAQALPMTAVMLGAAGVMLIPLALCRPAIHTLHLEGPANPVFTPTMWGYMLLLGIVVTGLSTVAFFYLVLKRGPLFAGMTTYIVPMLALAWGQFDKETISLKQLLAMGGVLVMVGIVQSGTRNDEELVELLPESTPHSLTDQLELAPAAEVDAPVTLVADQSLDSSGINSHRISA